MREIDFVTGKKKVHCQVPESWDEISEKQFWAIIAKTCDTISDAEFYAQYFGVDANILEQLDIYNLYVMNGLLSLLGMKNGVSSFIIPTMKLKEVSGHAIIVEAPMAKLAGMSFQQFMTIDTFYTWYVQTKNQAYLVQLCSCCYLMKGEDFFDLDLKKRCSVWSRCDKTVLNAVLAQWSLIKTWLAHSYPYLFSGGNDIENGNREKVKISNQWLDIFDALVEDDFTRIMSYKKLECLDVIRIINRKIRERKTWKG